MPEETTSRKPRIRKVETVRSRTKKSELASKKSPRFRRAAQKLASPLKSAAKVGRKEFYLPMPDNRLGRFLNKRRSLVPRYFSQSWQELRNVTWLGARDTIKLTLAVFTFATVFGLLIALTDYGLDKLFRQILL